MVDEVVEKTEIEKLHDRIVELEHKTKPVLVHGYLSFKFFLSKYVNKYPVESAWISFVVGAGVMYMGRSWFSF